MDFKQRYLFSEQWSQLPARRPGWSGQDALETRPGPGGGHGESLLASFINPQGLHLMPIRWHSPSWVLTGTRATPGTWFTTWHTASAARAASASSRSSWESQKKNVCIFYLRFEAMVTKATPINLANHVYFNLAGHKTGAAGINRTLSLSLKI